MIVSWFWVLVQEQAFDSTVYMISGIGWTTKWSYMYILMRNSP